MTASHGCGGPCHYAVWSPQHGGRRPQGPRAELRLLSRSSTCSGQTNLCISGKYLQPHRRWRRKAVLSRCHGPGTALGPWPEFSPLDLTASSVTWASRMSQFRGEEPAALGFAGESIRCFLFVLLFLVRNFYLIKKCLGKIRKNRNVLLGNLRYLHRNQGEPTASGHSLAVALLENHLSSLCLTRVGYFELNRISTVLE